MTTGESVLIGGKYHPFELKALVDTAFGLPTFEIINTRLLHSLMHVFVQETADLRTTGILFKDKFDDLKLADSDSLKVKEISMDLLDTDDQNYFSKVIMVGERGEGDSSSEDRLRDGADESGSKRDSASDANRQNAGDFNDLSLRVAALEEALDELAKALALCCNKNDEEDEAEALAAQQAAFLAFENEMNARFDDLRNELMAALNALQDQICALEKQVAGILEDIRDIFGCLEDHFNQLECMGKKFEKLMSSFLCVKAEVSNLMREREARNRQVEEMIEQMESIKIMKANKDAMMRMLDLKEDKIVVIKKLDASIFNCYQREFGDSLKVINEKLIFLKDDIRHAVEPIWKAVTKKSERDELCVVKNMLGIEINTLADQLNNFVNMRMNPESPITTERFMQHLKCTVCEDNVLMQKNVVANNIPQLPEVLLKVARPVLSSRLNDCDECHQVLSKQRSCGGRFTLMTPEDRLSRRGHFLQQFNVSPTNNDTKLIEGEDGCMYRASPPKWPCDNFVTVKDAVKKGH